MKTINKFLLISAITGLGILGACTRYPSIYDSYYGRIDDKDISFRRNEKETILKAESKVGDKIIYVDKENDGVLERVIIKDLFYKKIYDNNSGLGSEVLQIAQKQYDKYLDTIKTINYHRALESIKR